MNVYIIIQYKFNMKNVNRQISLMNLININKICEHLKLQKYEIVIKSFVFTIESHGGVLRHDQATI